MTESTDPAQPFDDQSGWNGDSAIALLLANTATGQSVLDLDDDPTLRAAAATTGRRYSPAAHLTGKAHTGLGPLPRNVTEQPADLITLTWPRADSGSSPQDAWLVFTVVRNQLADGGHVAVLLAPTRLQPFTVTWTGSLLTAASRAGLNYVQDLVCLHEQPDAHRVVLILRRRADPHAH